MKLITREALEEFRSFSGERNCCLGKWEPAVLPSLSLVFKLPGILYTLTWLADYAAAAAKSLQSRLTLCDTIDGSHQAPPSLGFSRQEYWSRLPFPSPMHESEKSKWSRSVSGRLFATPWTAAFQAPPSMGFSRQEYWSGVPLPSPGGGRERDKLEVGIKIYTLWYIK